MRARSVFPLMERSMPNDKDFTDRNAHERTQPDRPTAPQRGADRAAEEAEKDAKNPLRKLRYGSAGSGGAELEPGPERP
jgi:hypothetical protein